MRLRDLLKNSTTTQAEIAKICGVSQTAVYYWTSGRFFPGPKALKKLAQFFGVTMEYLTEDAIEAA